MTVIELEEVFKRIIDKLDFEIGRSSEIEIETDLYRLVGTSKWNAFDKKEDWYSASEIDLHSLKDDVELLEKLARESHRPCTYVDFDRAASLLREVSQVYNPL
ncbi:MAG: hypothetical protein AAF599_13245 [Bacteroidota bacterium]